MNDFFVANNESLPHTFIDQEIELKQVQVKDLNRFAQYANPFKDFESYSIEIITPLVEPQILNIMSMCSIVTSLQPSVFTSNTAQTSAIADLVLKIIQVNEAFFKKEKKQQGSGKESTWFTAFAYLVNAGHRPDDIMDMTYGAFIQYLKEAQAIERQQIKSYAIATRVANNAKEKGWDNYLKQMEG